MADVTRRRTGEFLRILFSVLSENPEGLPASQCVERVAASITMTPYEAGIYESSGSRRFDNILRFATVDCVKAGWLLKHKGIWAITDAGKEAYKAFSDPEVFNRQAVRLYREWKAGQQGQTVCPQIPEDPAEQNGSSKAATITFEKAEEQAGARSNNSLAT